MSWYAFQVKDFYDRPSQYRELKALLMSEYYKFAEGDIFIWGDGVDDNQYYCYVFVRYEGEFALVWNSLYQEKYVRASEGYLKIPDIDIEKLKQLSRKKTVETICQYDCVHVEKGIYAGLYGIALEPRGAEWVVGFNFFTGPRFFVLPSDAIKVRKSLFTIWKLPVCQNS